MQDSYQHAPARSATMSNTPLNLNLVSEGGQVEPKRPDVVRAFNRMTLKREPLDNDVLPTGSIRGNIDARPTVRRQTRASNPTNSQPSESATAERTTVLNFPEHDQSSDQLLHGQNKNLNAAGMRKSRVYEDSKGESPKQTSKSSESMDMQTTELMDRGETPPDTNKLYNSHPRSVLQVCRVCPQNVHNLYSGGDFHHNVPTVFIFLIQHMKAVGTMNIFYKYVDSLQ